MVLLVGCSSGVFGQVEELKEIFEGCHLKSPDFDSCMKVAFNDVTKFYKTGKY